MNEDELSKFVSEQKFIKAEIGDDLDDLEVNDVNDVNEENYIEEKCVETFVPNIKDDDNKQDDVLKDIMSKNLKRGQLIKDVIWDPGFFLKS